MVPLERSSPSLLTGCSPRPGDQGSVVSELHGADAEQKQKLYAALGLRLTYKPAAGIVVLESRPIACTQVGVGGGLGQLLHGL
jgi:hypothetical protein